jgi:hypothetical protein
MYGFPAGRPFRLIGREGSFAKIQDVKSGATGWIDESTLTVAPSVTAAPGPSDSPIGSTPHEPVAVPSEPEAAPVDQTAKHRGIFGGGQEGISGFLNGVFGTR